MYEFLNVRSLNHPDESGAIFSHIPTVVSAHFNSSFSIGVFHSPAVIEATTGSGDITLLKEGRPKFNISPSFSIVPSEDCPKLSIDKNRIKEITRN